MSNVQTFTVGDNVYEMRLPMKRVELYENNHRPILATFAQNGGTFSISEIKGLIAVSLKAPDGAFVNPKQGITYAEELLEEYGYLPMVEAVNATLERDCGFFFKGTSID